MIGWTLFSEVRAWAIVTMIIPFLPGIEWYSRDLKGQHRLLWFFYSLFFPFTVVGFRVKILWVWLWYNCPCFQLLALFVHTPELGEFNLWMNGPRFHWGRGLQLTLQLFIIFNRGEIFYGDLLETVEEEIRGNWPVGGQIEHWGHVWVGYVGILLLFVLTSWMAAEQIL